MIGDAGAHALAGALKSNCAVTALGVGSASAHALCTRSADVSLSGVGNGIGDAGACAIASALRMNSTATAVDLAGVPVCVRVCSALETNGLVLDTLAQASVSASRAQARWPLLPR
jgi:hypothetical protein